MVTSIWNGIFLFNLYKMLQKQTTQQRRESQDTFKTVLSLSWSWPCPYCLDLESRDQGSSTHLTSACPYCLDLESWDQDSSTHLTSDGTHHSRLIGSFHFLNQSFAETQLSSLVSVRSWDNQSPQCKLTSHSLTSSLTSSLMSPYFLLYIWISEKVKWLSLIKT